VIEDADELILIDAIDTGAAPGTAVRLEHAQLPRYLATKISPHQVDLRDVLALAELRGTLPPDTVALGLQPVSIELRNALSDVLRLRVDLLAASVAQELARRGYAASRFPAVAVHA
jgi:hydrogenase maturation protease